MMAEPGTPGDLDIEAYLADAEAELRRCQEQWWWAVGPGMDGGTMPIVVGFDGVREVLRDGRLSARSFTDDMVAGGLSQETAEQFTPLFRRSGEDHRFFRTLLASAFTPRSVERLRPMVRSTAERLVDVIAAGTGVGDTAACEFVEAFAEPLPPEIFAVLFGLPTEDTDRLAAWANIAAYAFFPGQTAARLAEVEVVGAELRDYCTALIEERRRSPGDDLVSRLVAAEQDGTSLDDREIVATMSAFIFAGAETTKRQLTEMIVGFSAYPDLWDRVAADPSLIPGAVEETLRYRGIVPGLTRVALEEMERDGMVCPVDQRVLLSFTAANHDPAHFPHPDSFDIERPEAADHLTFGWGPHFCLGAGLARIELQESLAVLTTRFGAPRIDSDALAPSSGLTAPDRLPVQFELRV